MNAGHTHCSSNLAAEMEAGSRPVYLLSGFLTLGVIQRELPGPLTSLIPTSIQLGYAAGLFSSGSGRGSAGDVATGTKLDWQKGMRSSCPMGLWGYLSVAGLGHSNSRVCARCSR